MFKSEWVSEWVSEKNPLTLPIFTPKSGNRPRGLLSIQMWVCLAHFSWLPPLCPARVQFVRMASLRNHACVLCTSQSWCRIHPNRSCACPKNRPFQSGLRPSTPGQFECGGQGDRSQRKPIASNQAQYGKTKWAPAFICIPRGCVRQYKRLGLPLLPSLWYSPTEWQVNCMHWPH